MKFFCLDIEADGLLDTVTKIWCISVGNPETGNIKTFTSLDKFKDFISAYPKINFVVQNGVCYDIPLLNKFGITIPLSRVADSLALSYYLCLGRRRHGLEAWGEDLGIAKPVVEDWKEQGLQVYTERCEQDVRIEMKRWKTVFLPALLELYNNDYSDVISVIQYLNYKMKCLSLAENNRFVLDEQMAFKFRSKLSSEINTKKTDLEKALPKIPVYKTKNRPKIFYKKDGSLSQNAIKWLVFCKKNNSDLECAQVEFISDYKEPNANSVMQIKNWLFSLGWEPKTFKHVKKDKDKETYERELSTANVKKKRYVKPYYVDSIPQIYVDDGEICQSIHDLSSKSGAVESLGGLGVLSHRLGIVEGFIKNVDDNKCLTARAMGFTNTLRLKHTELVNLPSPRKLYGEELRSLLVAGEGRKLIGCDLKSLEDRIKHHYQWEIDPEYVKAQQQESYDPHLLICEISGLLTKEQCQAHKDGVEDYTNIRHKGKNTNYACQYGSGVENLIREFKFEKEVAKLLHDSYWKLNWSIKEIEKSIITKKLSNGTEWIYNPVNCIWYFLKNKKDKWSTLVQGTASYVFDMWLKIINRLILEKFDKEMPLSGQFHDEFIFNVKDNDKSIQLVVDIIRLSIIELNSSLCLNSDMDTDIKVGYSYADVH